MGYCEDCSKCGRLYDHSYFPQFCPWCYVDFDKLRNAFKKLIETVPYNSKAPDYLIEAEETLKEVDRAND